MTSQEKLLESILARLKEARTDEQAWTELYKRMWPWVFANTYRFLHGAHRLAEDASQEVFIRIVLYCPFEDLQDPSAFRAYLRTVCKNVARTYLQQIVRRSEVDIHPSQEINIPPVEQKTEIQSLVEEVLGTLDKPDQLLIKLTMDGYTLREIVAGTELSYSNTAIRLHRIRKKLRHFLSQRR